MNWFCRTLFGLEKDEDNVWREMMDELTACSTGAIKRASEHGISCMNEIGAALKLSNEKRRLLTSIIKKMQICIQKNGVHPSPFSDLVSMSDEVNNATKLEELAAICARLDSIFANISQ